jgi:hypothetical protein
MRNVYDKVIEETYRILVERFGQPVGKQVATVGVADEGPDGKRLHSDDVEERDWDDPNVVYEDIFNKDKSPAVKCDNCGDLVSRVDTVSKGGKKICLACEDEMENMRLETDDPGRSPIEHVPGSSDCSCDACQEYWENIGARTAAERRDEPGRKAIRADDEDALRWYNAATRGRKYEGANYLDEDDSKDRSKLDPKMYSHIKDRQKKQQVEPGDELTMKSLGGGRVGGHGSAKVDWNSVDEIDDVVDRTKREDEPEELDDYDDYENVDYACVDGEQCPNCGSFETEQISAPSMYAGNDYGIDCLECNKTTWADPFMGGFNKGRGRKTESTKQKRAAKSFVKGTKKFSDKVKKAKRAGMENPEGFAAWAQHTATGKWPSEK